MSVIRWGLVSTANINRRLIPAIRMSARGELVAVASRSAEKGIAYAAQWEIPQVFDSYEAMFASDQVDAVYVSLPNSLHAEATIQALRAGKHVLCEKPFATTLADVDAMIAAADESGCILAEAFMYRHHPQTKILGEWVHGGRLGEIRLMRASFGFYLTNEANVRLSPELDGGSVWDVGIYPISLAQYVMGGPPKSVWGLQQLSKRDVDVFFAGQMDFGDGRFAQFDSSFSTPFTTKAEIVGTKGRLTLTRPFTHLDNPDRALTFTSVDGDVEEIPVPEKELYLGEVEDMHAAILDGAPPYLTLEETRNHVRTALALYQSAAEGRPITLD